MKYADGTQAPYEDTWQLSVPTLKWRTYGYRSAEAARRACDRAADNGLRNRRGGPVRYERAGEWAMAEDGAWLASYRRP